ncbi:MAG: BPL-N domain-containing protein [Parachlamydia sp.]|nr:BPL-N domain-containing protein [Parachlamydia sp.]
MEILIYRDEGAHPQCIRALVKAFQTENIKIPLSFIDRATLHSSNWKQKAALLIFPGGRDIPYHEALKGQANREIRSFVEEGGNYLGICAGGYYGSAQVEFEKGQPLEVIASRELAFFPGTASGPAYGLNQFSYETEAGAHIARLQMSSQEILSYFNGGCSFEKADEMPQVKVLARYQDLPTQPAAIVECAVGKGRAILCGVHPEYSAESIGRDHSLKEALQQIEVQRRGLFRQLLARFQIA